MHALSKGSDPKAVMSELFGKQTGLCRGQGGSMHMFDKENGLLGGFAFIGEGIPIGLGAAFQSKCAAAPCAALAISASSLAPAAPARIWLPPNHRSFQNLTPRC